MGKFKQLLNRVSLLESSKNSDDTEPLLANEYGGDCEHTTMDEINGSTFCTSCGIEKSGTTLVSGGYHAYGRTLVKSKSGNLNRGDQNVVLRDRQI